MGNKLSISRKLKQKETFEGNYIIKINELQIDRIQQMHHILKSGFNNTNFYAPLTRDLLRGIEVLDVGAGPGTWIFDMSSEFPKSQFTGVEIQSFMLPTIHPSNTKFIKKDILQGIPFPPNSFDFIHMRNMTLCFTEEQYEIIIKGLVDLLKPNGYLELSEPEMASLNMGPISQIISNEMIKFLSSRSMNPFINEKLHELLEKSGLKHVTRQDVLLPTSELDGKVGALYGHIIFSGLLGLKDILAKQMKLTKNEINSLLDGYLQETKTTRMYNKYTRAYGKKIINDIV
ncbi:14677_t:CDS:2 [Funneliformis caledonium]|uniref:14677_t:CDS:1 n=1 Tax=Funneliformis caledonium TaxID=1117310 RepID=A0A9N8ZQD6_9GLOM|nr:14677_t:CDS:2 [Funneliformis caledonium]